MIPTVVEILLEEINHGKRERPFETPNVLILLPTKIISSATGIPGLSYSRIFKRIRIMNPLSIKSQKGLTVPMNPQVSRPPCVVTVVDRSGRENGKGGAGPMWSYVTCPYSPSS